MGEWSGVGTSPGPPPASSATPPPTPPVSPVPPSSPFLLARGMRRQSFTAGLFPADVYTGFRLGMSLLRFQTTAPTNSAHLLHIQDKHFVPVRPPPPAC